MIATEDKRNGEQTIGYLEYATALIVLALLSLILAYQQGAPGDKGKIHIRMNTFSGIRMTKVTLRQLHFQVYDGLK